MNKGQLNLLIEYALQFLLESESVVAAGITKKHVAAGGKNQAVSLIRGVVARLVVEVLGYDKRNLCPHFGDCTPANAYQITRNANILYETDSGPGQNFKAMADATLAAVVKKFGEVDDIKFKSDEGSSGAGDEKLGSKKPRVAKAKKAKKKARGPYKKRGDSGTGGPKDKLEKPTPTASAVHRLEFASNGEVQPMIALLIYSYLQTNPELKVKDLADAFGLSVAVVEHAVCNVMLELRDAVASSPEVVCIKAGIERLRVLTAGPKKK